MLERGTGFSSGELAEQTGLSRQALQRHLTREVREGRLVRMGRGRGTRYHATGEVPFDRQFAIAGLAEHTVWLELEAYLARTDLQRTRAADGILAYVVTELVNNAIDHSRAPSVRVRAERHGQQIRLRIDDPGIGALESIRSRLGLENHLHALQELSKGKVTTQPDRHTGEGIFFASKMVDRFELEANGLDWIVDNTLRDQAIRETEPRPGTQVGIRLDARTRTTAREVFDSYTHDFQFDTTRCVVRLFEHGTSFVSRSEAKRLLANLDRFREVILDFRGVEGVGQGFVDEVFRVWARDHPEVTLIPVEMNAAVEFMVRRGLPEMASERPRPVRE
ncbi:MAG TPA: DUF4325 domain-containing protein [Planctomycetota bacterium]|nr:DUF4325 domain-containing protein [Planctomycetota bacterium]